MDLSVLYEAFGPRRPSNSRTVEAQQAAIAFEQSLHPEKFTPKHITQGLLEQMATYDTENYRWDIYRGVDGNLYHVILKGSPYDHRLEVVLAGIPDEAMEQYKNYKETYGIKGWEGPPPSEGPSFDPSDAEV